MSPATPRKPQVNSHNVPSAGRMSRLSTTIALGNNGTVPASPASQSSSPLSEPPEDIECNDGKSENGGIHAAGADSSDNSNCMPHSLSYQGHFIVFSQSLDASNGAIGMPTLLLPAEIIATQDTKIQVPIGEVRHLSNSIDTVC